MNLRKKELSKYFVLPLLFFVFVPFFQERAAANQGLVVSLKGQAWIKNPNSTEFSLLSISQIVTNQAAIKTGKKTVLRILNPNGSMIRIDSEKLIKYQTDIEKNSSLNLRSFLNEFAQSGLRYRQTSVRRMEVPAYDLLNRKLNGLDIHKTLYSMALFSNNQQWNHLNGGLARLKESFSHHPTLSKLNFYIPDDFSANPQWDFWQINKQGKRLLVDRKSQLKPGTPIQVTYRSEKTGYMYLFLTSYSPSKMSATELIYPLLSDNNGQAFSYYLMQKPVLEQLSLILPNAKSAYIPDGKSDTEIFWSLSCVAPLKKRDLVDMKNKIDDLPKGDIKNIKKKIKRQNPSVCPSVLINDISIYSS